MSPDTPLAQLRIVLVEPAGPLNIGSAARVMKNFGLSQLVLVNPQCDPHGDDARQMAVHAYDLLEAARIVDTLSEALAGCQRAIATTARSRDLQTPLESPEQALPWLLELAPTALIFGPEDRGLNNDEMLQAQRFMKIDTRPPYESLNLAQAVAVCCYELSRLELRPASAVTTELPMAPVAVSAATSDGATLDQLDGYYHHLESTLLKIGYLYPHTAPSRMRKFRQLGHRAALSAQDVAMLRGILRQIDWATHQGINSKTP